MPDLSASSLPPVSLSARLYGVGVGPGDPDLITLKASRVIRQAEVVAAPVSRLEGESHALNTIAGLLRADQRIERLPFPMSRDLRERERHRAQAVERVQAHLGQGRQVVFVTEGDPLLHSTFIYLLRGLPPQTPVEIVPGVTSISAAAAEAALPLVNGDQRLAVLPATGEDARRLPALLREFDTLVLLKIHRALDQWLDALDALPAPCRAVFVERASTSHVRVVRDVASLRGQPVHYLSLLILQCDRNSQSDSSSE